MKPAILIAISLVPIAFALGDMPSLYDIFIGNEETLSEVEQLKLRLPETIFVTGGIISNDIIKDFDVAYATEADLDLINTLTNGLTANRTEKIEQGTKTTKVNDVTCSVFSDQSGLILTKPDQLYVCYTNINKEGAILRLYDIENNMEYLGEKIANKGLQACFDVESDHMYFYDLLYCTGLACNCNEFINQHCIETEGKLKMLRVRDCSPDFCDLEQVYVDWVDTSVEGCKKVEKYCRETDAGKDYLHYGRTIDRTEVWKDICIDSKRLKEYYCDGNTISSTYHYCLDNQECIEGACITTSIKVEEQGCGIVEGIKRNLDDRWCDNTTRYSCIEGNVEKDLNHSQCQSPKCNYKGILFDINEKVCLGNGKTIIECIDPDDQENMVKYSICEDNHECKPDSRETTCTPIISNVQEKASSPPTKKKTIWDWIGSLLKGGK